MHVARRIGTTLSLFQEEIDEAPVRHGSVLYTYNNITNLGECKLTPVCF